MPKVIAFYLPQFHPFKENDQWWGKGFTEWTNVANAKKLFPGHYQPKIPSELGFYDLRLSNIREEQANLARAAGIYGFCYWHYWFGNKRRLMADIFQEVLESGKPDFPFCLGWANHSWYSKLWRKDAMNNDRLLIKQEYPGEQDIIDHFQFLLKAFSDPRYIRINNKPLLYIFAPQDCPKEYISRFQELSIENGFKDGLYIVANISIRTLSKEDLLMMGYSAVTYQRLTGRKNQTVSDRILIHLKKTFFQKLLHLPDIISYSKASRGFINPFVDSNEDVIPTLIPNWDHTPRSGRYGFLLYKSTPGKFAKHCHEVLDLVKKKRNKLIFLKSWNEWGEGNYMEPDLKYGRGYIDALRNEIDKE